ncbi:hypothetical protein [Methanococcoides burtonii]|uniref:Uncharacterized protein n=1 Tax=Methanococcoides burtonii (strain DSM 6242 / NBRC 107633 / OCM 468 / ACE-M) TaxID=259564 RepID=Q12YD0_METBU|nr:hypothetical protein [Methanococcoides burtonii]ABE51546.1 Hypothetical protein Mbur_0572 [Methanococcoides burtonii DSM 6242]
MIENDIKFEEEVVQYLNKNGKMRREQLIEKLRQKHTKTYKTGEEFIDTGYSKPTINRKLKEMLVSGEIIRLYHYQLQNYGFLEDDGRATYLFTEEGLKVKTHIDNVLQLLSSGDDIDKQMALKELNRYEKLYSFDESQLDLIVKNLTSVNADLTTKFLVTLYDYIIKKGKEPTDKDALLKALRSVLDKYEQPKGKSGNVRNVAINLLSHYKDEGIIDQIIKDATTLDNPHEAEEDYDISEIAELIINNPSKLFEVERQLMREGKHDASQFISNIRTKCMAHLGMSDVPIRNNNIEGAEF